MVALSKLRRGNTAALAGLCALVLGSPLAATAATRGYKQVNLVSDQAGVAAHQDPNLVNPWGVAFIPGRPFWVANNHSSTATLYDGEGNAQPLVVTIPGPGGTGQGAPTGQVANTSTDFNGDIFIFATEDGTIAGWKGGTAAVIEADQSASGAIYKGLALASNSGGRFLFAADFHNGKIDVFDKNFQLVNTTGKFVDPHTPSGYAPFNVHLLGSQLFVTYAKQDAQKEDDDKGAGHGFVDVFTTDGTFVRRFATGIGVRGGRLTVLNSPWGVAQAPATFGQFKNDILIGNFGSGQIAAFDRRGRFKGVLKTLRKRPIAIRGLWEIVFGAGGTGDDDDLYFSAGTDGEQHGLFGDIEVATRRK